MKLFFVKLFIALARNFETEYQNVALSPRRSDVFRKGLAAVQKALLAAPQKHRLRRSIAPAACNIPSARHDLYAFVWKIV